MPLPPTLHATAVSIHDVAVLLMGPSGAGKSDLALRLIDRGATLIADDRVIASPNDKGLFIETPPTIAGLIEVRGVGLIRFPYVSGVRAGLVVQLGEAPQRLPEDEAVEIAGVMVPLLFILPFQASAPICIELAVAKHAKAD